MSSRVESRSGTVEATPRKAIPASMRDVVVARQKAACARCGVSQVFHTLADGTRAYRPMQIDHVLPIELGGDALDPANLQALCLECHKAKTREDIKRIRKAARLRRDADPETRRKSPRPLRSKGFSRDPLSWRDNSDR